MIEWCDLVIGGDTENAMRRESVCECVWQHTGEGGDAHNTAVTEMAMAATGPRIRSRNIGKVSMASALDSNSVTSN